MTKKANKLLPSIKEPRKNTIGEILGTVFKVVNTTKLQPQTSNRTEILKGTRTILLIETTY